MNCLKYLVVLLSFNQNDTIKIQLKDDISINELLYAITQYKALYRQYLIPNN